MNDLLKLKIEKLPTCPGGQTQKPRQPVFYPLQGAHGQGARDGRPDR